MIDFILIKAVCRVLLLGFEGGCHARMWKTPNFYIAQYHALPTCLQLPLGAQVAPSQSFGRSSLATAAVHWTLSRV
jgi:hypothetical protein